MGDGKMTEAAYTMAVDAKLKAERKSFPPIGRTKMNEQEMRDKLPKLIADHVGVTPAQCTPDARFIEDLRCDSLDVVEITMAFEEEFDIEINDSEMETVSTVGQAADMLAKKLAAR